MRLTAQDLREMNILKYYRLTRKWVCKTYGLKDADLDLHETILSTEFIHTHGIKQDGRD
jgi:sulfur relay (sulfurtransferase) DsrF/TusC family protein